MVLLSLLRSETGAEMRPIEQVIKAIEEAGEKPLPSAVRYDAVLYLEMLRDLMSDTSHYFFSFAGDNLKPRRYGDED